MQKIFDLDFEKSFRKGPICVEVDGRHAWQDSAKSQRQSKIHFCDSYTNCCET